MNAFNPRQCFVKTDPSERGVTGLSYPPIMPVVTSGNTNATAIAIGEKAADLIRARYS